MKNYYEILGIQKNATQDEIKRAYFKKVRMHSPEKDPENFKLIREAYDVLSNENLRRAYDAKEYQDKAKKEIEEAIKLMEAHAFERALAILQKLMGGEIRLAICYVLMASCYIRLNLLDKAINILEDALKDNSLQEIERIDIAFILIDILIDNRMTYKDEKVLDFIDDMFYEADEYVNSKIISSINEANETKNIRAMNYYIWLYNYLNEDVYEENSEKYIETIEEYVEILKEFDILYWDDMVDKRFKDLIIYLHEYRHIANEPDNRNVFNGIVAEIYKIGDERIIRNIEIIKAFYKKVYEKYKVELNAIYITIKEKEEQNKNAYNSNYQTNQVKPTTNQQTQGQNKNEEGCGGCLFLLLLFLFFLLHC